MSRLFRFPLSTLVLGLTLAAGPPDAAADKLQRARELCAARFDGLTVLGAPESGAKLVVLRYDHDSGRWRSDVATTAAIARRWQPGAETLVCVDGPFDDGSSDIAVLHRGYWLDDRLAGAEPASAELYAWLDRRVPRDAPAASEPDEPKPDGPLRVGGDVKPPVIIRRVKPRYPEVAKASRVQGIVIVEAIINTRGSVDDVEVLRGHPLLEQAAIDSVRQWRFRPGQLDGEPVPVFFTMTVSFTLR